MCPVFLNEHHLHHSPQTCCHWCSQVSPSHMFSPVAVKLIHWHIMYVGATQTIMLHVFSSVVLSHCFSGVACIPQYCILRTSHKPFLSTLLRLVLGEQGTVVFSLVYIGIYIYYIYFPLPFFLPVILCHYFMNLVMTFHWISCTHYGIIYAAAVDVFLSGVVVQGQKHSSKLELISLLF